MPALANVGCLKLAHLCFFGHGLPHFPSALTQLVALEYLDARANEFAELPAGITALLRLTALLLGRCFSADDPLQMLERVPLDTRALGDLSGFPSLRELTFDRCEVMLCESLLGAARHASLVSIDFCLAYPASECALVVLQLSQALKRLGRGSVLRLKDDSGLVHDPAGLSQIAFSYVRDSVESVWAVKVLDCWTRILRRCCCVSCKQPTCSVSPHRNLELAPS